MDITTANTNHLSKQSLDKIQNTNNKIGSNSSIVNEDVKPYITENRVNNFNLENNSTNKQTATNSLLNLIKKIVNFILLPVRIVIKIIVFITTKLSNLIFGKNVKIAANKTYLLNETALPTQLKNITPNKNSQGKNDDKNELPKKELLKNKNITPATNSKQNINLDNSDLNKSNIFNADAKKDDLNVAEIAKTQPPPPNYEDKISIKKTNIINKDSKELADQAYEALFKSPKIQKLFDSNPYLKDKSKTNLEKFYFISDLFIKDIKAETGEVNAKEAKVIEKIELLPLVKLHHHTKGDLTHNDTLLIASGYTLLQNEMIQEKDLTKDNRSYYKVDRFTSLLVDFSGSKITAIPTIKHHGNRSYGTTFYTLKEAFAEKYGFFTLTDLGTPEIKNRNPAFNILTDLGINDLVQLIIHDNYRISTKLKQQPLVAIKDMRKLMSYYTIKILRILNKQINEITDKSEQTLLIEQHKKLINFILNSNANELNQIMNAIFNPLIKIPQVVAQKGEYEKHNVVANRWI